MERAANEGVYEFPYREAVRALSQQENAIESFRGRAGLLFSAAAIVTSFFGAQALSAGGANVATWAALAAFFGLSIASLAILWPREWEFSADARYLISNYIETDEPLSPSAIQRDLALHLADSYQTNRVALGRLYLYFRVAGVLLAAEVALWVVDLTTKV